MSHFNNVSNNWDDESKIQRTKIFSDAIIEMLSLKKGDQLDIMDLGCGTGLLGLSFFDYAKSITGVDTAEKMLEVFNQKSANEDNCRAIRIDLERETLEQKFDLIMSSMAFHHLENPIKMVGKLKGMLNSGGALAIIDLDQEDGSFHPDNQGMGVKHFGFAKEELESWAQEYQLKLDYKIIKNLEKNDREYGVFLAVLK